MREISPADRFAVLNVIQKQTGRWLQIHSLFVAKLFVSVPIGMIVHMHPDLVVGIQYFAELQGAPILPNPGNFWGIRVFASSDEDRVDSVFITNDSIHNVADIGFDGFGTLSGDWYPHYTAAGRNGGLRRYSCHTETALVPAPAQAGFGRRFDTGGRGSAAERQGRRTTFLRPRDRCWGEGKQRIEDPENQSRQRTFGISGFLSSSRLNLPTPTSFPARSGS